MRHVAERELIRRGPEVVPVVIAVLENASEKEKRVPVTRNGSGRLRDLLSILGSIPTDEGRRVLYAWLQNKDYSPHYRCCAAVAILQSNDCGCIPFVGELLQDTGLDLVQVRTSLLPLMAYHCRSDALPHFRSIVESTLLVNGPRSHEIFYTCVLGLEMIGTDEAWELLGQIARHNDSYQRQVGEIVRNKVRLELVVQNQKK